MPKILHSLLPKSLHFWLPFTLFLLQIHTDSLDLPHRRPSRSDIRAERHIAYARCPAALVIIKSGQALRLGATAIKLTGQLDRFRSIGLRTISNKTV